MNKFHQAEQSYRAELPYHRNKVSMANAATEDAIAKEEAQIAHLNGQIRRQNGHHNSQHNHHQHHHHHKSNHEKKEKEKQVRPSIIRPSIFSHHLNVSKRNVSFHCASKLHQCDGCCYSTICVICQV